jgi:hypothetical protein
MPPGLSPPAKTSSPVRGGLQLHPAETGGNFSSLQAAQAYAGYWAEQVWNERSEEIPPGSFRAPRTATYRTNDGKAYFEFRFVEDGSYWEIDILSAPSYGTRSSDLHSTHRLPSARGGYRICLADPSDAHSVSKAFKFAESWSEMTWRYIQTGKNFGE